MVTAREIIRIKGGNVWTVEPDAPVIQAVKLMADHNVSSIVVVENNTPVGMFTERHFVHTIGQTGKCPLDARVKEYMIAEVISVDPDQPLRACLNLMLEKKIRQLPLVEHGQLQGIASIGDVLSVLITEEQGIIADLQKYIAGRYDLL